MKNNIKPPVFLIIIIFCAVFSGILYGCGPRGKYFTELKASYSYDKINDVLVKFPSEITFEPDEILEYSSKKPIQYKTVDFTLSKRDIYTGKIYDYKITIGYCVHNGKFIFTEIPLQYTPENIYTIGGSVDSVIVSAGDENAFLVNFDNPDIPGVQKIFEDSDFENYFDKDAIIKLIYAKIISVSPDGKYILYLSNREYIKGASPSSADIYFYDMQTKKETKIMNFDNKEFLFWENTDINPGASGNFLFRETSVEKSTGKKIYSDILRYSLTESKKDVFLPIAEKYRSYEIIDDRRIYIVNKTEQQENENVSGKNKYTIYTADIYKKETTAVFAGRYSSIWNVKMSENGEYLAFFGSYLNIDGKAVPEIVTLHMKTNDIVAHYEQNEDVYFIDSFFWCPGNVLIVNFQNMATLYSDLCRFHEINHKNLKTDQIELPEFIPIDAK